jgi:DNA-binding CsgD family transcriptional regulator
VSERRSKLSRDYLSALGLGDILRSDVPLKNAQEDILKAAVDVFAAESGQFCLHDSDEPSARKEKTALLNLSWRYTDQYINYYHKMDPFLDVMPEVNACRNTDLMPRSSWQKLEFNNDFLKPQNINHLLVMYLRDDNHLLGHIDIHRNGSGATFSQKELFKAQYLATMFSRGIRQKQLLEKSADLEKLLKQIIEVSSAGIAVLDSSLNSIYWNNKISEFGFPPLNWKTGTGCSRAYQPMLPHEVMDECRKLQSSMRGNRWGVKYSNRRVVLWTDQNRLIEVEIEVVPAKPDSAARQNPFYFILIFNEVHRSNFIVGAITSHERKLTPKEMEIAQCICQGLTNKEISHKLYIALPTVASHIHHIFQKFDVKSRSKLIHVLQL